MWKCNVFILVCSLLVGCQILKGSLDEYNNGEIYRPPSPVVNTNPTEQTIAPPATIQPNGNGFSGSSQQPTCTNNLVFIADQTIPDGTQVSPEAALDKQWEVENQGTCNWDENYRLKLIAGSPLAAPPEQALFPARSDSRITIRIQFTAPQETGNYHSAWQAFSPSGEPFGDPIFIEIVVVDAATPPL